MELVNRVAESDIDVFDLAALWDAADVAELDLAPWLHRGLVLREKDFRAALTAHAWEAFAGRHVAVHCSTDAIVPTWAWMLVATRLEGVAASVAFGREADARRDFYVRALAASDFERYRDRNSAWASMNVPSAIAARIISVCLTRKRTLWIDPSLRPRISLER